MANLTARMVTGLGTALSQRQSPKHTSYGDGQQRLMTSGASSCVERRDSNHMPHTVGSSINEPKITPCERLGMALEFGQRRQKFVAGRLKRHIVHVEHKGDQSASEDAQYVVHFSDGNMIGMSGIRFDGKNARAFQRRHVRGGLKVVQVVIDVSKSLIQCVQDILDQLAWHAQNIFGVMLHRQSKPKQNGEPKSKYRRMNQFQPCCH